MKTHSQEFKENISKLGRQLKSRITYTLNDEEIELGNPELNSVTLSYETSLLKSVMKYVEIDSNVEIPAGTIFKYELGLKTGNEYEYLNYGNYVVKEVEIKEDTNSYLIKAYDKMLYSMIDYKALDNITYPITIRDYIGAICTELGLTFANSSDTFANYDKEIPNELFLTNDSKSLGYTFRDVLDQLAETTGSNICINSSDQLEVRYLNNTNDTIDESYLKNINVNFGKKFGPVNSIVLSRSAGADNVYLRDEESVSQNGLCEYKIVDNQIMNGNDRGAYLEDLLEQLDGLEYYINDFDSTGICYYDICDKYNVSIGDNTYNCILLNDTITITQGLEENIYTKEPEETNTDYTKADKTDQRINQTTLIVNKQEGEIQALASKVVDISNIAEDNGTITLENAHEGILHKLEIRGNISLVYPNDSTKYGEPVIISDDLIVSNNKYISSGIPYTNKDALYPSTSLYTKDTYLQVDDTKYKLDFDYLNYLNETTYDKWIYQDGKQWIERNVGLDSNGNLYALNETIIEEKPDLEIQVKSDSTITLLSFASSILKCEYLLENIYTDNFATEVYVNSEIKQTADQINLKVSANDLIAQLNIAVEDKQGIIDLKGNTVTIESDNFTLDETGHIGATAGDIGGFQLTSNNFNNNISGIYDYTQYDVNMLRNYLLGNLTQNATAIKVNDANDDNILNSTDLAVMRNIILGNRENTKVIDGKFVINSDNPKNCVQILDSDNNASVSMGVGGVNAVVLTGRNLVIENPEEYNSDAPHYVAIDEAGTIKATGAVSASSFVNTSLASEKKNFKKLDKALDIVKEADIYSYNWKDENRKANKHYGLVIGEDYNTPEEFKSNDGKGIDLYATMSICLQAIKEQQEQIEELRKEIDLLKEEKNGKDKLYK